MFNLADYFVPGNAYGNFAALADMFVFMTIIVVVSSFLLVKTFISLKKTNNEANKYLIRTMLGILLWNIGEWILTITELATNEHWGIFSGLSNVPLALGLVLTVNSFFVYMQYNLKLNKYKQRRKLINQRVFSIVRILSVVALYLFALRFLALPFMSQTGKEDSLNIIIVVLIILSFLVLLLMILLFIQLLRERNVLSSKLDKIRVNFYLIFLIFVLIGLFNVWAFLLSYLITELKDISTIMIYLVYLPSLLAILFLYYAVFLPDWIQKRLGLLPKLT